MDSLLATYASSDEEEGTYSSNLSNPNPNSSTLLFSSLPVPKSSSHLSLIENLPQPKSNHNLKKLVQFKPPPIFNPPPSSLRKEGEYDDDDDDDGDLFKRRKQLSDVVVSSIQPPPSVSSFLSSIPAPKNSRANLGSALSSSASGSRRSIIDTDVARSDHRSIIDTDVVASLPSSVTLDSQSIIGYSYGNASSYTAAYGSLDGESGGSVSNNCVPPTSWTAQQSYASYGGGTSMGDQRDESYEGYTGHVGQYQYEDISYDGSVAAAAALTAMPKSMTKTHFKRGRNEIPTNIIEVKQDELMKNRPREDQAKLTGIAFGPSYQPVASTKGKPSKLHKRKHQIGALYFDMKQKEMELSERRAKGFLTKAETHAKYGW